MTVGETLSHARRASGLSVDDVAAGTCVRATLIHAIEADSFQMCGAAVYAKGHIRSYARVVGIDPEPLVAEFDAAQGTVKTPAVASGESLENLGRSLLPEHRRPVVLAAGITVLVVVCAVALAGFLRGHGKAPTHHSAGQAIASHQHQPVTSPSSPAISAPPVVTADSHATLKVKSTHGQSWLSITTKSGKVLYDGLLAAGEQRSFTSHHDLKYVIGNAPAVDVVVNGTDIGSPPSSGNVAHGKVSPGVSDAPSA